MKNVEHVEIIYNFAKLLSVTLKFENYGSK